VEPLIVRTAVRLVMEEKAAQALYAFTVGAPAGGQAAFNALGTGSAADQRRQRAIYRREIVRRYNGGREFRFELHSGVQQWIIGLANALSRLDSADVPNGVARKLRDLPSDPYLAETGFFHRYTHPQAGPMITPAIPVHFSKTPAQIQCPPPTLGEHTRAVLSSMGYSDSQIQRMST